ncbi:hypothetical protein [Cellulomonas telluris]|uniref:hypothetical protein n=1 Tax=Cellulomonas telluris TaxID=2306636 RepID=UPI0010A7EC84|nr:hypothetical protein [Cellulomonas telluris]
MRGGRALRAAVGALVSCALALGAGIAVLVAPAAPAQGADLRDFRPGHIISDAIFYDSDAMSAAQVQSFLVARGAGCTTSGSLTCLKDYRQSTTTRPADAYCRQTYTGATNETAAQIVTKVARACGINPQVLLVTLQKEQGLITQARPKSTYDKALGFACPDTAPCDSAYAGFFAQVYSAARQFQRYAAHPTSWTHQAGRVVNVRYHPVAACSSSPVHIENQATASLYNYTPYQPNAAALAAGYGTGDSCSSYGNRNFWNYFTDWFGSTTQRQPVAALDTVAASGGGKVTVRGWAFDPDVSSSIQVHVYVDGAPVRSVRANASRPDVAAAFGVSASVGFSTTLGVAPGPRRVCVYAIDGNGGAVNPLVGCRDVVVANAEPIGALDEVTVSGGTVTARGWALDPDTDASIGVRLLVDGAAVASATASATRRDVERAYGRGAAHGYTLSAQAAPGRRSVCVQAVDATSGTALTLTCRTVTVTNAPPVGSLDAVTAGPGTLGVRGWALDPDTTASIRVHVYVDGKPVRSLVASAARPDVERAYGRGAAHGFSTTIPAESGRREVCVWAIDTGGGANPVVGCRTVEARNEAPVGDLTVSATRDGIAASGWVVDPDQDTALSTRLRIDGRVVATLTADAALAGSGARFGFGDTHGFVWSGGPLAAGSYELCVDAADASTGRFTTVACTTAVVNGLPIGALDSVTASGTSVTVTGWALDPNSTGPIRVHVYLDGQPVLSVSADRSRPDVERAYGLGDRHGYSPTLRSVAPGPHEVCTYAIDLEKEENPLLGCRSVTVG